MSNSVKIIKNIVKHTPSAKELKAFARAKKNVMLYGAHGVGKTMKIKEAFQELYGNNWKIFNGSTMDPWTDLVGIPKEVDGHIQYIKPRCMNKDLRAIFIDEYWRAKPQVRNALMELVQFKTINGERFDNLEVVWAATNPPESDGFNYDIEVENIDPAQLDRFHIHLMLDNQPELGFFVNNYGYIGRNLVEWWGQQGDDARSLISPRRLEQVAQICTENQTMPQDDRIRLNFCLPACANIAFLESNVYNNPVMVALNKILEVKKIAERKLQLKDFINNRNNFDVAIPTIVGDKSMWHILDYVENHEFLDELFSREKELAKKLQENIANYPGGLTDFFTKKEGAKPSAPKITNEDVFTKEGTKLSGFLGKPEVDAGKPKKKMII